MQHIWNFNTNHFKRFRLIVEVEKRDEFVDHSFPLKKVRSSFLDIFQTEVSDSLNEYSLPKIHALEDKTWHQMTGEYLFVRYIHVYIVSSLLLTSFPFVFFCCPLFGRTSPNFIAHTYGGETPTFIVRT